MCEAKLPPLIPAGWTDVPMPGSPFRMLHRQIAPGLQATFSIDVYCGAPDHGDPAPLGQPGSYRHLVISRRDRYPGWNEMRDLVRSCGLFDRSKDVFMLIPPDDRYVNVAKTAFHWLQKVDA